MGPARISQLSDEEKDALMKEYEHADNSELNLAGVGQGLSGGIYGSLSGTAGTFAGSVALAAYLRKKGVINRRGNLINFDPRVVRQYARATRALGTLPAIGALTGSYIATNKYSKGRAQEIMERNRQGTV